jgi:hypothetical protein
MVLGCALANAGITYTCDPTVSSIDGSGVCNYLNSNVAKIYNTTFSNANANIYITTSSKGLGVNYQVTQFVSYSTYITNLSLVSTDITAFQSLPFLEPAIFGGADVGLTAALTNALGISGGFTLYGAIYGYNPGAGGTDPSLTSCVLGSPNCYSGVIEVVTPAALATETAKTGVQSLWYRDVAGTASGPQPSNDYDYFSVVEHETDEVLGTASCSDVNTGPVAFDYCTPDGGPSAVDLFRYSAPGTRVYNSLTHAYFSANGGVTDLDGNTYNTTKADEDYADFSQSCVFVQDAEACPGKSVDINNDYKGGPGPEIPILSAVGYAENGAPGPVLPEPSSLLLFGSVLTIAGAVSRRQARLRKNVQS